MLLEVMFAFLALFLGLKAIEYRGSGPLDVICSLGAWICAVVTAVLVLTGPM